MSATATYFHHDYLDQIAFTLTDFVNFTGTYVNLGKTRAQGLEVEQRIVRLGPARGDQVSVTSGLKDGEVVVSSGVFKLRPHAPVQVNNEVQPSNELSPKPKDT